MKASRTLTLFIGIVFILSSCSSLELTQSRYGNGIGLSLAKSSKKELKEARLIKLREKQEYLSKKYGHEIQSVSRVPQGKDLLSPEPLPAVVNVNTEVTTAPEKKNESIESLSTNTSLKFKADVPEEHIQELDIDHPEETEQTQGNMTNLGYLGAVLVIAGLILMLLGVGNGWGVLVLGVILIVVAYFLG